MGVVKQINIKNQTYYFYNDIINLKNFKSNLLKIDLKNHTKTLVFTILDILQLKKFDSTDENKELQKKYNNVWDGIKNEIKTINVGKGIYYEKD